MIYFKHLCDILISLSLTGFLAGGVVAMFDAALNPYGRWRDRAYKAVCFLIMVPAVILMVFAIIGTLFIIWS